MLNKVLNKWYNNSDEFLKSIHNKLKAQKMPAPNDGIDSPNVGETRCSVQLEEEDGGFQRKNIVVIQFRQEYIQEVLFCCIAFGWV